MGLIDTHTHLDSFHHEGSLELALDRARNAGLEQMITIGTGPEDWALYRDISRAHPGYVRYAVGLHPCSVEENWPEAVAQLEAFWTGDTQPVALGETGLDRFHLPKDDDAAAERLLGWQKLSFVEHIRLAKRLGCPLVVHSRGAFRECMQLLEQESVAWDKVVFHCFSEGAEEMKELKAKGGRGSFTGVLTYKNAQNVRDAALVQGLDRFMVETDAPYLTPVPNRGKPNEPAFLRHTAEFAAKLFEVDFEILAAQTTATAKSFYQL
jgi:TatD DNase family protein